MALNDISLTAGMRSNLLSLQHTVDLLNRTQNRLSTGKKVNSAIDNPVSFFAAQALTSRASKIDSLKDAMGQAVQTITSADKGITAISAMIEQAKGIAQQAQSAAPGTAARTVAGTAAQNITYANATITVTTANGSTMADDTLITVGGVTFGVATDAGGAIDILTGAGATTLRDAINNNTDLQDAGYAATLVGDVVTISRTGHDVAGADITISAATEAAAADGPQAHSETWSFTVSGVGGATYTGAAGADAAAAAGNLQTAIRAGAHVVNTSTVTAGGAVTVNMEAIASDELVSLQDQYNQLLSQIDTLAADSGYKGKNLLGNDLLSVKFEGTHKLDVQGFDASSGGLNVTAATWTAGGNIDTDIGLLDNAMDTLSQNSSKLSGNLSIITVRQDFSKNMINTLTEGSDKLTLADTNEEGANMLMLQTRQSLSTTALSLSAQAAQSVLRLFQ